MATPFHHFRYLREMNTTFVRDNWPFATLGRHFLTEETKTSRWSLPSHRPRRQRNSSFSLLLLLLLLLLFQMSSYSSSLFLSERLFRRPRRPTRRSSSSTTMEFYSVVQLWKKSPPPSPSSSSFRQLFSSLLQLLLLLCSCSRFLGRDRPRRRRTDSRPSSCSSFYLLRVMMLRVIERNEMNAFLCNVFILLNFQKASKSF